MKPAAFSCLARWKAMPAADKASITVSTSPPGMPKAYRLPAWYRRSARIRAALGMASAASTSGLGYGHDSTGAWRPPHRRSVHPAM